MKEGDLHPYILEKFHTVPVTSLNLLWTALSQFNIAISAVEPNKFM